MRPLPPVFLRRLDVARDAPDLHHLFGDDVSCRYLPRPATKTVEETRALLQEWTTGTEQTSWAVTTVPDGPALGRVTMVPAAEGKWETAVMICPEATGQRLATRAMGLALDIMFEQFSARRIIADIDPDNAASLNVFKALGFQQEAYFRADWVTHLGVRDTVIMALLNTDPRVWQKAQTRN